MRGKIIELNLYDATKSKHGFIEGNDGKQYYFNQTSLLGKVTIDTFYTGDMVSFAVEKTSSTYDRAIHIKLEQHEEVYSKTEFSKPGISSRLDLKRAAEEHLKQNSGEYEIILKLAEILRITRVGHHSMDQSSQYQFCLASVTESFKQFVRESGEFLIIFSHFDNKSWQQKTLKVERELRKRRDMAERRPLVNFYILVSNASELRAKIDSVKGEPHAAVIPFSFEELLDCTSKNELTKCMLTRFGEYYFENNMLGENDAIDDDNLLFGDRGKIADAVVVRCHQGSNSGIFGLRRSGKTSVLNAVLRRLDWENTPYVLVESRTYETFSSWKSVLFEIACLVRARMQGIERQEDESLSQFYTRLNLTSTEEEYEKRGVACFIDDMRRYCSDNLLVIALDEIELITYNTATSETWKNLEAYKGLWSALRGCGCPLIVCGVNSTINEVSNLTFNNEQCDNPMYGRIMNCSESSKTYLPAFTDNQTKEFIRMRDDHKAELKKIKQQILSFCLRQGYQYDGSGNWTAKHVKWLRSLKPAGLYKEILDEYLLTYTILTDKLNRLDQRIEELASKEEYKESVSKLTCFLGIKTHTALSVIVEVGDFQRFVSARKFAGYLGLVPGQHSSGDDRNGLGITKAGNTHVRRLLVESAQSYTRGKIGYKSRVLRSRQAGNSPQVINYADRANERLRRRYYKMVLKDGKKYNIAKTAIARELACFIWGMMTDNIY